MADLAPPPRDVIEDSPLDFPSPLKGDIKILAPTVYAKLNVINYCQYLKLFLQQRIESDTCDHSRVLEAKVKAVRAIILNIVNTDAIFRSVDTDS